MDVRITLKDVGPETLDQVTEGLKPSGGSPLEELICSMSFEIGNNGHNVWAVAKNISPETMMFVGMGCVVAACAAHSDVSKIEISITKREE